MKYISEKEMKDKHDPEASGVYYIGENVIYIAYPDSWLEERFLCINNYYILGHELEHFIFEYYLKGNDEDNQNHNSKIWLIWALKNGSSLYTCSEYYIYTDVDDECQELDK